MKGDVGIHTVVHQAPFPVPSRSSFWTSIATSSDQGKGKTSFSESMSANVRNMQIEEHDMKYTQNPVLCINQVSGITPILSSVNDCISIACVSGIWSSTEPDLGAKLDRCDRLTAVVSEPKEPGLEE